ncbi:MAG: GNAT family N-acetyltransferase [Erysipelotrichaceae bacterium]|nr:GNAT family N-acetyltransferase [Erysipelotrichaceae bacterium]
MKLIEIWNTDKDKSYDLCMSFPQQENGFENSCYGISREGFDEYILRCKDSSLGINLKEGYVPDTKYVLADDEGNYVGIFKLRHRLNEKLADGAGHIGYGIRREYRGKGYAAEGLRLCLEKCKEKGIREVYLSCNKDNIASYKTQLKNGAVLHHEDDKEYYTRIYR